ncbi:UbiD family decarboxylase [Candidatus Aerophobetes bacterium]|nr:UbiD family decarboxylase [Candidatus Aerophobetes bacterium]
MSFNNLREFIKVLEEEGELKRIKERVSTRFELSRLTKKYERRCAVLFENVAGYSMPVVVGLFNKRRNIGRCIGISEAQIHDAIIKAAKHPGKVHKVNLPKGELLKSVVIKENIDLLKILPIPFHYEKDAGHYITSGVIIAKDIETGIRNVSFARMEVKGKDKLGIMINRWRHLWKLYEKAEKKEIPLEVAIVIGPPPAVWLEGAMPDSLVPLDVDELEVASAFMKTPLQVTKCETIDVDVPIEAEIVIEGKILPKLRELEGPFGDFAGFYDPPRDNPIVKVTAITYRKNAIYQDLLPATREHFLLGGIPREAALLSHIKGVVPEVKDVCLSLGSCSRFHCFVQINKRKESDPYVVITSLLSSGEVGRDLKVVVVVDEDVDIYDSESIEWAVATRVNWKQDVIFLPKMPGTVFDPSAVVALKKTKGKEILTTKVGIDATVPLEEEHRDLFGRIKIPGM